MRSHIPWVLPCQILALLLFVPFSVSALPQPPIPLPTSPNDISTNLLWREEKRYFEGTKDWCSSNPTKCYSTIGVCVAVFAIGLVFSFVKCRKRNKRIKANRDELQAVNNKPQAVAEEEKPNKLVTLTVAS
ncbi:hypothetical protein L204_103821 [Cryptococcus depauperatus]